MFYAQRDTPEGEEPMTPVICGRDGEEPVPLTDAELAGVRRAMTVYRSTELIPRLLATIDQRGKTP